MVPFLGEGLREQRNRALGCRHQSGQSSSRSRVFVVHVNIKLEGMKINRRCVYFFVPCFMRELNIERWKSERGEGGLRRVATLVCTKALIMSAVRIRQTLSDKTDLPRRFLSAEAVLALTKDVWRAYFLTAYLTIHNSQIKKNKVFFVSKSSGKSHKLTLPLFTLSSLLRIRMNSPMCLRDACIYSAPLRAHRSLHHRSPPPL